MNASYLQPHQWPALGIGLLIAAGLVLTGCGKDETSESATATSAEQATASTEQTPADEPSETPAEESTTDALAVSAESVNVDESLQAADQATKNKDWQKATDALLKLQLSGAVKSDQQSWDYNRRMTVLQGELSEAADSGDARAKAAIDLLRKSRRVR